MGIVRFIIHKCFVIVIGDLNGDFGNALGDTGFYELNNRGLKLLDFANYFNLCPTNLLQICCGPLETFVSHCGNLNQRLIIFYCHTVCPTVLYLVN